MVRDFRLFHKSKKAFLLAEETLKIILSVIGIGFLIFLLSSIYFNGVQEKDSEHAKNILKDSDESLKNTLETIEEDSEESSAEMIVENPDGWSFFSFILGEDKYIPRSCSNNNCICICDSLLVKEDFLRGKRQYKECGEEGECLIVPELNKFEEIKIDKGINQILVVKNKSGVFLQEI